MAENKYVTKKVEFAKVIFNYRAAQSGKEVTPITLTDILQHKDIQSIKNNIPDKKYQQLTILADNPEYIIGAVITTSISGIPPKHNFNNNSTEGLDLTPEEGLGYANVFLYYKTKEVMLYEFNRNGCYLSAFTELLQQICGHIYRDTYITLEFFPLLQKDTYETFQTMRLYKTINCVVAKPTKILAEKEEHDQANEALSVITKDTEDFNADTVELTYNVNIKNDSTGLTPGKVKNFVSKLFGKYELQKLVVSGLLEDPENKKVQDINLLIQTLKGDLKLKEPKILTTLLLPEREKAIIKVYEKNKEEIDAIIQ